MKFLLLMSWCGLAQAQDGQLAGAPTAVLAEPAVAAPTVAEPAPLAEPPTNAPPASDDEIDRITGQVSAGLRCPVCQGLSVNDSPAEGARSMKARVRELVAMGYTGQQINDYFVERYGTWILLAPPAQGTNWTVYLAPVGFLVVGAFVVGWTARRRPSQDADPVAEHDAMHRDDLEPYRQRVLAELGLQDGLQHDGETA